MEIVTLHACFKLILIILNNWECRIMICLFFLKKKIITGICQKLVCNLNDKKTYFVQIRTLKPALNHGLIHTRKRS